MVHVVTDTPDRYLIGVPGSPRTKLLGYVHILTENHVVYFLESFTSLFFLYNFMFFLEFLAHRLMTYVFYIYSFLTATSIPKCYRAVIIHGFVEELVVNEDPEYQWIDRIRTPRASNEARQRLISLMSGIKYVSCNGYCCFLKYSPFKLVTCLRQDCI